MSDSDRDAFPALEAISAGVDLDSRAVVADVNVTVQKGQFVAVIGPNGAGKTTLLRAVAGLLPYHGSIRLSGQEIRSWRRKELAARIGFVQPAVSIAFDFRVLDLVMLGRSPHKPWLSPFDSSDRTAAMRALASVDLEGFERRSVHSLSSGERQRVFLAQALTQDPDVLLLDEPTTHLDIHHQFSILGHVRRFVQLGGTAVAAFHDLEIAARYGDRLLVLAGGRVAAFGAPQDVLSSELVHSVFHVDADVILQDDGVRSIRYHISDQ